MSKKMFTNEEIRDFLLELKSLISIEPDLNSKFNQAITFLEIKPLESSKIGGFIPRP
jgi:hypothetical protein